MIEDMKKALNPAPLIQSVFGSGYPQCRRVTLPVGDAYGRIEDADTGEKWISDPSSATFRGGKWYQTKWVQDVTPKGEPIQLSRDEWVATAKTHFPDGKPKQKEGFTKLHSPAVILVLGAVCFLTFSFIRHRTR
jgi:hypothetical protein